MTAAATGLDRPVAARPPLGRCSASRDPLHTGGSGLGLAITRHLVEAHGGAVTVSSEPGAGATFRITPPVP